MVANRRARSTASPRPCDGLFTRGRPSLADPDFVDDPGRRAHLEGVRRQAGRDRSERKPRPSQELASFADSASRGRSHDPSFQRSTTRGNAVALTYTLEDSYGAKCVVAGAGFLLNNEMGDFNLIPGRTDATGRIGTPANLIAPRKRMLSSQTPTLVAQGRSSASGHRLAGRPDDPQHGALGRAQPGRIRVGPESRPSTRPGPIISGFPTSWFSRVDPGPSTTRSALTAMGHKLGTIGHQGNANTIVVDPDGTLRRCRRSPAVDGEGLGRLRLCDSVKPLIANAAQMRQALIPGIDIMRIVRRLVDRHAQYVVRHECRPRNGIPCPKPS